MWSDGCLGWAGWGEKLGEFLGLEPVSLVVGGSGLGWFGHVGQRDGDDWVQRSVAWEVGRKGRPRGPGEIVLKMT